MSEDSDQEDKTEDASERKIEQAIERGEVPKSMEAATFFSLAAGTLALMITGTIGLSEFVGSMRGFLGNSHQVQVDSHGMMAVAQFSAEKIAMIVGVPFLFAIIAGIASGLVMHRPLWTVEPMMPKLNRISIMSGYKRIFGKEAFVQFAKSFVKFLIVAILIVAVLWPERARLDQLVRLDPIKILDVGWALTLKLLGGVLAIFAFVAAIDVIYQRFTWMQRLKMTREEMKKEFKETEGSPEIKARIRKLRAEMLRQRMMQQVPKASVIITNPTHYSVALRYEAGMNAPILLAKGVDSLAMRIREVAGEHEIPIIENVALARALYARVEIDQEIPEEHYKAVAEVIGYVMRLRRGRL
ncbi:MAG: flagellar biosynthesis protein FlhB [Rhizobiales bacterium PAR1]|nr:MAG: flagellar biosynthesis protein FlhB [Rhizobiales bacterium PAR1]